MSKEERKLTEAEEKRKKNFEEIKSKLISEGYEAKDLTIGVVYANIMALVLMLPIAAVFTVIYININGFEGMFEISIRNYLIFIISLFVLIVVHELIHGLFWGIFAKSHFKAIEFGIIVKMLTPYCCCKEILTKSQYIIGGIMPTVILGIIPSIVAIFINSGLLFIIGIIMIVSGGGDATILLKILRYKSDKKELVYMDHPYECGLVVFER